MDFFTAMEVASSGLSAQRTRMNVASSNMANVSTTRTPEGGPYRRRDVQIASMALPEDIPGHRAGGDFADAVRGVKVESIIEDIAPPHREYDPSHPDAGKDPSKPEEFGYVAYPNINVIEEMVDMITASRAYEAGISLLSGAVSMANRAIQIGRG